MYLIKYLVLGESFGSLQWALHAVLTEIALKHLIMAKYDYFIVLYHDLLTINNVDNLSSF